MAGRRDKKRFWNKKTIIGGVAGLVILTAGGYAYMASTGLGQQTKEVVYQTSTVAEGTLASSTLLSGTVKAKAEQYVYFDATKGSSATVTVKVGDKVTAGQQLVQYDTTTAQATYDEAVRALNKVGRDINQLTTYGVPQASTSLDEKTGQEITVNPTDQANAEYQNQLQTLYESYASAEAQVAKAQAALNETIFLSDVEGTVVEINDNIDPSARESQVLVHVTSEGKLQVEGHLTEYDLANIKVGQAIKIKSKVYPDKEWTGKITYISNYPAQNTGQSVSGVGTGATSGTGASYAYKAEITSDLGELKQGFSVSVEVVNEQKSLLVPLTALVTDGDKSYVWVLDDKNKVSKVEVTTGDADAVSQEISAGLTAGQTLIVNPDDSLKANQKLEDTEPFKETEVTSRDK
ncbi:efflux RND transporter periplasmic adaptor subunit [Streptococcus porci]|uniref:efflux RND transporter periplasmic adaptor subunit n=1 Tax=Streptococcus porci TaxID=502567 RepID=UPI00041AE799|nr:efflux RND transporter periplasmic adaptor subunit [Streptococcus porci]